MAELMAAHNNWANRPADERFPTLAALHTAALASMAASGEKVTDPGTIRAEVQGSDVVMVGKGNTPASLTNWAFGQLSGMAGAPAGYLRTLPPTLACQNLNHGLKVRESDGKPIKILAEHKAGGLMVRAMNGENYARIYQAEITPKLLDLESQGWRVPAAYPGGPDRSPYSGIYMSDRDLFVFMVHNTNTLDVEGCPEGLGRGFFMWNSEVGDASIGVQSFLLDRVCGNHIVWGAREIQKVSFRHVGKGLKASAFQEFAVVLEKYQNASGREDELKIKKAQTFRLYATKDEVLDGLFSRLSINKSTVEQAVEIAERTPRYGDPLSAWALAAGLTETAQLEPYAADRIKIDKAAGKLLEMAF